MITIQSQLNSNYAIYYWCNEHLWAGAADRWNNATHEQRVAIIDRIESYFLELTDTELNDFIWFECDDIFFPEEEKPVDFTDWKIEIEGA